MSKKSSNRMIPKVRAKSFNFAQRNESKDFNKPKEEDIKIPITSKSSDITSTVIEAAKVEKKELSDSNTKNSDLALTSTEDAEKKEHEKAKDATEALEVEITEVKQDKETKEIEPTEEILEEEAKESEIEAESAVEKDETEFEDEKIGDSEDRTELIKESEALPESDEANQVTELKELNREESDLDSKDEVKETAKENIEEAQQEETGVESNTSQEETKQQLDSKQNLESRPKPVARIMGKKFVSKSRPVESTELVEEVSDKEQGIQEIQEEKRESKTMSFSKSKLSSISAKASRPIIQVKNLVKKYGDFVAVDGISFDVKRGEVFGILGPNGAGKTTTLEIIETILSKTSGNILLDGLDIEMYPEQVKSIIGVQLQHSGFFPNINLVETLQLFADIYNVKINPIELLQKVGLKDKAKSRVEQLSGGQKQRFSITTTLVADPEIVFLDEPTTGLDPQARRNLWDMILDLKKNGKTIVITTHYMDEAEQLCDRIAIMDSGKILEINTAEKFIMELLDRGFKRPQPKLGANLEDVFLDLTGKAWRD